MFHSKLLVVDITVFIFCCFFKQLFCTSKFSNVLLERLFNIDFYLDLKDLEVVFNWSQVFLKVNLMFNNSEQILFLFITRSWREPDFAASSWTQFKPRPNEPSSWENDEFKNSKKLLIFNWKMFVFLEHYFWNVHLVY